MTSDGPGLWGDTAAPAPHCPPLEGVHHAQVAVVGAGYTGLSAALHLARAGVSVSVLEGGEIGAGGSGRNVGLVNAGLWLMPDEVIARAGAQHGPRLLDALAAGPALVWKIAEREAMDCEASATGTLHCAPDARGASALAERARQWQARGADVALLDTRDTRSRTGSPAFQSALFDPRAGTIQPLSYARELARAAQTSGAGIFTQSPVLDLSGQGTGWRLKTAQGSLEAEQVILATNAYSTPPFDPLRSEISVLPYFNFATEPLPPDMLASILPGREGAWDTRKILTSFRCDAAGRLILGSIGQLGVGDGGVHKRWAERKLEQLFPQLAGQRLGHGWWGRIGTTPDALPRLHQHGRGVWSISGYNGRGIAPGTIFGRMLADLVSGAIAHTDIPLPLSPVMPDRVRILREAIFRGGSVALHLLAARN